MKLIYSKYRFIKELVLGLCLVLVLFLHSCESNQTPRPDNYSLTKVPAGFPPIPFPDDNPFSKASWELGKKLFYDPILSLDSSLSCGSCHKQNLAFADDLAFSPGVFSRPGVRNSPSLANIAYHPYYLREGSVPTLEMQILVPIQEHNEFNHDILSICDKLDKDSLYVQMSMKAYGKRPNPFVLTRAIANFERTILSGNSSFDAYFYQNQSQAISANAIKGMDLFFSSKTQCYTCHEGFNFTDYSFNNNGLDSIYADEGRKRVTGLESDNALFKVPSLRNVAVTAPYMHNGKFATLDEVLEHYNNGGANHPNKSNRIQALNLSAVELQNLKIFLESLTDESFLTNPLFVK